MSLTTFQLAKRRQGFQPAGARTACQNCHHVSRFDQQATTGWQCMLGGFFTTAMSVCEAFEQRKPKAVPPG